METGQTVLFAHRTSDGDSFVGYGVIDAVHEKDDLSETELTECNEFRWKWAIEFKYVIRFEKPLLISETFLRGSKLRGKYLHGLSLNKEQVAAIALQVA